MKTKKLLVVSALLTVALTACGGGGGRPSTADIEQGLKDNGQEMGVDMSAAGDDVLKCVAKALHDSDLSDDALKAMVDGDKEFEGNEDDTKALADAQGDMTKCATDAVSGG